MEKNFKPLSDRFRTHADDLKKIEGKEHDELVKKYIEQCKNNKGNSTNL